MPSIGTTKQGDTTAYTVTFGRSEIQRVNVFGSPSGGTFKLDLPLASGTLTTPDITIPGPLNAANSAHALGQYSAGAE